MEREMMPNKQQPSQQRDQKGDPLDVSTMSDPPRRVRHPSTRPRPKRKAAGAHKLQDLPNRCCTTGICRSIQYWPVDYAQEGLLRLEGAAEAVPVQLFAFSSRGVGVVSRADCPIQLGAEATLITQAHGAGCSYRKVRCCWSRPHPQDEQQLCIGLRFEVDTPR